MRHSPLVELPESFGIKEPLEPHWHHQLTLSDEYRFKKGLKLLDYCDYFQIQRNPIDSNVAILHDHIYREVFKWRTRYDSHFVLLSYKFDDNGIHIKDTRDLEVKTYFFGPVHRALCDILKDGYSTECNLIATLTKKGYLKKEIISAIHELLAVRVIIGENKEYVWLAFPEEYYTPERWGKFLKKHPMTNSTIYPFNE